MLVLSRHLNETIMIGDGIEVTVVDIKGDQVRLGIKAHKDIKVYRKEIYDAITQENIDASSTKEFDIKKVETMLKDKMPKNDSSDAKKDDKKPSK